MSKNFCGGGLMNKNRVGIFQKFLREGGLRVRGDIIVNF